MGIKKALETIEECRKFPNRGMDSKALTVLKYIFEALGDSETVYYKTPEEYQKAHCTHVWVRVLNSTGNQVAENLQYCYKCKIVEYCGDHSTDKDIAVCNKCTEIFYLNDAVKHGLKCNGRIILIKPATPGELAGSNTYDLNGPKADIFQQFNNHIKRDICKHGEVMECCTCMKIKELAVKCFSHMPIAVENIRDEKLFNAGVVAGNKAVRKMLADALLIFVDNNYSVLKCEDFITRIKEITRE